MRDGGHTHFGGDSTVGGVAGTLSLHELGVGVEMQDAGVEGGVGDIEGTSGFEVLGGDGMDAVEFVVGAVDENELIGANGLGIIGAPTFGDRHLAFDGKEVGEEFADDEEHEPQVNGVESEFGGFEGEAAAVGDGEVDKHEPPDGVSTKHGDAKPGELFAGRPDGGVLPCDDEAFEVKLLGVPDPVLHLVDRAKEDEHHRSAQENNSQFEGTENL